MVEANNSENNGVGFAIQRIYTKDISYEAPNTPTIFQMEWKPEMQMSLDTQSAQLEANVYEVVLKVTVTAKVDDKLAFLCEVQQAGIFTLNNIPDTQLGHAVNAFCPNILFPYAREVISSLVNRGSFPHLNLAPVDFDAVFESQMKQQANADS